MHIYIDYFSYLQYFSTFVETVSNILDVDETIIEENKEASETASTRCVLIGHVNIGIIFSCIGNSQRC